MSDKLTRVYHLFLLSFGILFIVGCSGEESLATAPAATTATILDTPTDPPPTAIPPTDVPTLEPTAEPTLVPTIEPTPEPTIEPTPEPIVIDDGSETLGIGRQFSIPDKNVFPEGVSYDPNNGNFYVGATTDGALYVGNVMESDKMSVFSPAGADGRTAAVGTKVDSDGNLWIAGGRTGSMWVYNGEDASLIAQFTTPDGAAFINDLALTDSGVYFTDSFRPILWRVTDMASGEAEPWLDFTGTAIQYTDGFNLNGIVATEDGRYLIVVHSIEGELYRIDTQTQEIIRINTGVVPLTGGDGLVRVDNTVYVLRNRFGEIVPIILDEDLSSGQGGIILTSTLFAYPTTLAYTGNTFLVANSQFDLQGGNPVLPFTISQILAP